MFSTRYSDVCECPYCLEVQDDIDLDGDVWNEEIECEKCEGKFRYSLTISYDFTCEAIEGEGPNDPALARPYKDPNQLNLFQGATCV